MLSIADVAAAYLAERNLGAGDEEESWCLSAASPEELYEIYDAWLALAGRTGATAGRSWHERAAAPCRAVMRALAHTKRGVELFAVRGQMHLPGSPVRVSLRPEMRPGVPSGSVRANRSQPRI